MSFHDLIVDVPDHITQNGHIYRIEESDR
ncbi:hypothetical protein RED65_09344 [Oceanobacter sp. RED65]|uniref:Uncharacterized protein n=2 Tax=Bermanella marisrubri TaxID=207949 RepID=Q1N6K7_9GAMM|nr:hypothetical protein RED65_09344 [Oceanobacter sp. RED65] [Bermanella marisrubri]